MKINLENQKIYTLLFGKQILTLISKNPFGFIEVEFSVPETKSSSELITIQEQLTINFEEPTTVARISSPTDPCHLGVRPGSCKPEENVSEPE